MEPFNCLMAISRTTQVSRYQNVNILDFTATKDDGGGGDNCSYKTCKASVKSSTSTNQHPAIYRPNDLPVAQPTVSEHRRAKMGTMNEHQELPQRTDLRAVSISTVLGCKFWTSSIVLLRPLQVPRVLLEKVIAGCRRHIQLVDARFAGCRSSCEFTTSTDIYSL